MDNESLVERISQNVSRIVSDAIGIAPNGRVLAVYDERTPLAKLIASGYRAALPQAVFLDFDAAGRDGFFAALDALRAGDLVVLIQSSSFRLDDFRIRIELFKRGLAAVEHSHLERAPDEKEMAIYADSLAYDPAWYRGMGAALKRRLDAAATVTVTGKGTELRYTGGMEPAKLNVGDYRGMKNVGGTFPIGEVFTEPRDLAQVEGEARIFAFAGGDHHVRYYDPPFKIRVAGGRVTAPEAPPEFHTEVLERISAEEDVLVREFGLGLNPAMGPDRRLTDVTAFERQKGLHFSLGEKHGVYKKPGFNPKKTHYHIDIFVAADEIRCDDETIWKDGDFTVQPDPLP